MKKRLAGFGILAAAALALAGCTDSAAQPTTAPTDAAASGEMTTVRVAALPIAETGALWAAIDEGIFADHGLEIEVVPAQGGANAIPALLTGDLPIRKAVQDDGGDPSTIKFVEVAFPDVPAQLEAGTMDAAWAPDPFRAMVVGAGGVSVVQPYQATIPGLSVLTNITTQSLMDEDPELVKAYSEAMAEALEWA